MAEGALLPSYTTLTGAWVLDVTRSDSMEDYLRLLLDNPEQAIQAQAAGEQNTQSRNVIMLNETHLVIYKRTAANHFTETFELGLEKAVQNAAGYIKRSTASLIDDGLLTGYFVAISTMSAEGRSLSLVDARRLEEGGHAHAQELSVRNNTTGETCTIMRTWIRVPVTSSDVGRLGRRLAE
ncbi:unnamed protein product [Ectocarpus sp. 12 AP-2014]